MIRLRALEPDDLDVLYSIENDQTMWPYSDTSVPYSRDALHAYILTCSNDIFQDKQLRLVVESDGVPVGLVDLCNFSPLHSRAEVSIAVLPACQGQGVGAEALRQLARYASQNIHLHQLYAVVAKENVASLKAFQHVGFCQSSVLPAWIRRTDGSYADAVMLHFILEK